ncbi:peptide ABC transporter substrate-binding protein [Paenibacillus albiflavus]|uniref:Peptide ABC transporter substrate-binding protein n=1 Tax=Paenibacillus albiflavus TaxID=2545760 RepID=A0A4V2WNH9_9BACL|nr:peptide ABC transporter substrate-binding protein [Paenibacillus albiflavus]TCZ75552.1 peptide ABC transporter substrate-binding protein [Paenibacillus albiflavus]
MKQKKMLSTAVAVTLIGSLVAGCSSGGGNAANTPAASQAPGNSTSTPAPVSNVKQEIKMNLVTEPEALDVSKQTSVGAADVINALMDGLYRLDKDGKITMGVAKAAPKISADGLVYTIDLNPDAKWTDGVPVKAQDFVYSFRRTAAKETAAQYGFMMEWLKGGADIQAGKAQPDTLGVKALSDTQLEITLDSPKSFFTNILAFPTFLPQREDIVTKYGEKNGADADKLITNGPFKLTSWTHDQSMVLEKSENYWDAANVNLTKVTLTMVADNGTELNLYETKELDYATVQGDNIALYKGKPDLVSRPEVGNWYIQYQNKDHPVFSNANIRKAMALSIDRQALVDVVLKDGSLPATGLIPNGTLDGNGQDFRKLNGDVMPPFDAAKAKDYLAKGMAELKLTAFPKVKLTTSDNTRAKKILEFLISQWKTNLGIDIDPEPMPGKARIEKMHSKNFDLVLAGWSADYNDASTFLDMWYEGSPFNDVNYNSAAFTKNVLESQKETDLAKRSKLMLDAEKQLIEDMPIGPLYFSARKYLVRPNVEGMFLPPLAIEFEIKWAKIK